MRDEMNAKKAQDILQIPLPENKIQQSSSLKSNDTNEPQVDLTHKPKLLDKIPTKREEENRNFQRLEYTTDEEDYEMTPLKGSVSFDKDKDELETENDKSISNNSNKQESLRQSKIDDAQFNELMKHVYKTEGRFVDNPKDRGGRTNLGITQRTYDAYNKKHGLPLKDVKDISYDESDAIYFNEYWKASGADKIQDKNLAYLHFDSAINHGVGRAKKFLEQSGGDFDKYYQARKTFYDDIVKGDETQMEFYNGWMNRIERINKMRYQN